MYVFVNIVTVVTVAAVFVSISCNYSGSSYIQGRHHFIKRMHLITKSAPD